MSVSPPASDYADAFMSYIESENPHTLKAWMSSNEAEFCEAIDLALAYTISDIEAGARLYYSLDERQLVFLLSKLLHSASIRCSAEEYTNGHVDITIRHPRNRTIRILGECKIYCGYEYHVGGCYQLLVRYSTGRASRTFCLEFFQQPKMREKMRELRAEFDAKMPHDQVGASRDHTIDAAFLTSHTHSSSSVVEVLHLACNVYHPEAPPHSKIVGVANMSIGSTPAHAQPLPETSGETDAS